MKTIIFISILSLISLSSTSDSPILFLVPWLSLHLGHGRTSLWTSSPRALATYRASSTASTCLGHAMIGGLLSNAPSTSVHTPCTAHTVETNCMVGPGKIYATTWLARNTRRSKKTSVHMSHTVRSNFVATITLRNHYVYMIH